MTRTCQALTNSEGSGGKQGGIEMVSNISTPHLTPPHPQADIKEMESLAQNGKDPERSPGTHLSMAPTP